MISGTAKLAAVSKVLAGKSLQQNFLADIGETLRVAAIGNRHRHPDNILQRAAGALQCLLEILESLADLSVEVAGERGSRIVEPTWPASHIVLPPSVMTAGENEYFASQDGSMIVFFKGISGLHRSHGHSERHMAAD